ncbi:unnamed protein product [Meganyctiphanes norvegica]|uniref:E3 ubiquitin-protein ligase n=1 Tax=Meganyctiphanes norvegica TaxID=48144 RepID=A0AAV2Q7S1_MEGNR
MAEASTIHQNEDTVDDISEENEEGLVLCVVCSAEVRKRQHAICCDMCASWQHRLCNSGIDHMDYKRMMRGEVTITWHCANCPPAPTNNTASSCTSSDTSTVSANSFTGHSLSPNGPSQNKQNQVYEDKVKAENEKEVEVEDNNTKTSDDQEDEELECAVCLQKCVHPVRLPCSHIFCFLCVKGVANQSKRCAMCRQEIPPDFLDHPTLLSTLEAEKEEPQPGGYQWFYEGRNGWWQYDERTSFELENSYSSGQRACEVLVAGFLYIIDFDRMVQLRRNDPSRRRRIKRDLSSIPKKGVAGIKLQSQLQAELQAINSGSTAHLGEFGASTISLNNSDNTVSSTTVNLNNNAHSQDLCPPTPTAPSNTPQTPHTPSAASSSSGSPDTTDSSHLNALEAAHHHHTTATSPHHHHYHHHHHLHLPPPYHHANHHAHLHASPPSHQHITAHNSTSPSSTTSPPLSSPLVTSTTSDLVGDTVISSQISPATSDPRVTNSALEEVIYHMDRLTWASHHHNPEFYPLDDHLPLSDEEEEDNEEQHL